MHLQHPLAPSSDVLRQRVLCNKASSRGRLIGQNGFCAISCNCTKLFCAISCYRTKRVLCNKASLLVIHRPPNVEIHQNTISVVLPSDPISEQQIKDSKLYSIFLVVLVLYHIFGSCEYGGFVWFILSSIVFIPKVASRPELPSSFYTFVTSSQKRIS